MPTTLDTELTAAALAGARALLSDLEDDLQSYLATEGATLASNDYTDLRHAVRSAADRLDAAYLADYNERRRATSAWRKASPGDIVTTHHGLTGVLVNRGTIAGFIRPEGQDGAVRVYVRDVRSIESA